MDKHTITIELNSLEASVLSEVLCRSVADLFSHASLEDTAKGLVLQGIARKMLPQVTVKAEEGKQAFLLEALRREREAKANA